MTLRTALASAFLGCLGLASAPASAVVIPGGGSVGINFDFSGLSPSGPYLSAGLGSTLITTGGAVAPIFSFFDGLDATGQSAGPVSFFGINSLLTSPLLLDGVFSIVASRADTQGTAEVLLNFSLCANANFTNCAPRQSGVPFEPRAQVPEPGSLALLGLGGLGLFGALRARRRA